MMAHNNKVIYIKVEGRFKIWAPIVSHKFTMWDLPNDTQIFHQGEVVSSCSEKTPLFVCVVTMNVSVHEFRDLIS